MRKSKGLEAVERMLKQELEAHAQLEKWQVKNLEQIHWNVKQLLARKEMLNFQELESTFQELQQVKTKLIASRKTIANLQDLKMMIERF